MSLASDLPPAVHVDILLATYNGERFLAQQLDSILLQSHRQWRVLISDDGSADASVAIAATYAARDSRFVLVNTARQGGVVANFGKALQYANADYLMFCDQDDVWAPDKVALMLGHILAREATCGKDAALLGFSDLAVVDSALVSISPTFYAAKGYQPSNNRDRRYLAWSSTVYGCTVILNGALRRLADPMPLRLPMHDQWCALLAALAGDVFYVDHPTVLYRQHGANVVGARTRSLWQRLGAFRKNVAVIACDVDLCRVQLAAATDVLARHPGLISPEKLQNLAKIGKMSERLHFVGRNIIPFARERTVYAVLFAIIFVLRKYEK